MNYLQHLIGQTALRAETIASQDLTKEGITVTYQTFRLTR